MNETDWSPPQAHDPNPTPPSADPTIRFITKHRETSLTPGDLKAMPQQTVTGCYIVSTGHGISGPFDFGGVPLLHIVERHSEGHWSAADVISADGFRARISGEEMRAASARPILLAIEMDGRPLNRKEGLVSLIVPGETDDALRQVKWVSEIQVLS
jgi:DMSO/TMAO reductase YedYZ molybdopterin-dependent catalytic subunit